MYDLSYPAIFKKHEDGEIVEHFPDLPEALTGGGSEGEAFAEAVDCLQDALAGRICRRDQIPVASPAKRGQRVSLWLSIWRRRLPSISRYANPALVILNSLESWGVMNRLCGAC